MARLDPMGNEIDVIVHAEFADEAALAAYKAHPIYDETTQRVRPAARAALLGGFPFAAGLSAGSPSLPARPRRVTGAA